MTVQDFAKLGQMLGRFLKLFANCFTRPAGRALLEFYVRGLLSDVPRKESSDNNLPGESPFAPRKDVLSRSERRL